MPLPEAHPQARAEAVAVRVRAFNAMDAKAQEAAALWQDVSDAVAVLNPEARPEDRVVRLETAAVLAAMDWREVPITRRATLWRLVRLMHDVEYHGLRHRSHACADHLMTDIGIDPRLAEPGARRFVGGIWYTDPQRACWKCGLAWQDAEIVA